MSDRYHVFRDRAMKLNEEKAKRMQEVQELKQCHECEVKKLVGHIGALQKELETIKSSSRVEVFAESIKVNIAPVCRPGGFGTKRKVVNQTNTLEVISNGMGGLRKPKIDIPAPVVLNPAVKLNGVAIKKPSTMDSRLKNSALAISISSKLPAKKGGTAMDKWLKRT